MLRTHDPWAEAHPAVALEARRAEEQGEHQLPEDVDAQQLRAHRVDVEREHARHAPGVLVAPPQGIACVQDDEDPECMEADEPDNDEPVQLADVSCYMNHLDHVVYSNMEVGEGQKVHKYNTAIYDTAAAGQCCGKQWLTKFKELRPHETPPGEGTLDHEETVPRHAVTSTSRAVVPVVSSLFC